MNLDSMWMARRHQEDAVGEAIRRIICGADESIYEAGLNYRPYEQAWNVSVDRSGRPYLISFSPISRMGLPWNLSMNSVFPVVRGDS